MSLVYSFLRQGSGSWREEELTDHDSRYASVSALAAALSESGTSVDVGTPEVSDEINDGDEDSSSSSDTSPTTSSDDSSDDDEDCGSSQSDLSRSGMAGSGGAHAGGDAPSIFGSHTQLPHGIESRRRFSSPNNAALDTSLMYLSGLHYSACDTNEAAVHADGTSPSREDPDRLYSLRGTMNNNRVPSSRRARSAAPLQSSLMMDELAEGDTAGTRANRSRDGSPLPAVRTPTRLPSAPHRRLSSVKATTTHGSSLNNIPERQLSGTYLNPSGRSDLYGRLSSLKSARILLNGGNPAWKGSPNMQNFTSNEAALWASMQQNNQASVITGAATSPSSLSANSGKGSASRRARVPSANGECTDRSRAIAAHQMQIFRGDLDKDASLDSYAMAAVAARERGGSGSAQEGMPSFITNELTHSVLDASVNNGATTFRLLTFQEQDDGPLPPRAEHKRTKKDKKDKKDKKSKKSKKSGSSKEDKTAKQSKPSSEGNKQDKDLANGDLVAPPTPSAMAPQPPSTAVLPREPSQFRRTTLTAVSPLPNPSSPDGISTDAAAALPHASLLDGVEELNARNAASRRREAQEALRRSVITRSTAVSRTNTSLPANSTAFVRSATETQHRRPDFVGTHKTSERIKVYTQPPSASPSATMRRTTVRPKPNHAGNPGSRSASALVPKTTPLPPLRKK